MPTSKSDVLSSIRAGINTNPAAPILTALKIERKTFLGSDPTSETDKDNDLKDSLAYIKQTATVIAQGGLTALNVPLGVLASAWSKLPADDPTPGIVDQKKIRSAIRDLLAGALLLPGGISAEWLAERAEDFKRRNIGDYQNSDPCEAKLATARADIAAANNQTKVDAAIATVNRLRHLLQP